MRQTFGNWPTKPAYNWPTGRRPTSEGGEGARSAARLPAGWPCAATRARPRVSSTDCDGLSARRLCYSGR